MILYIYIYTTLDSRYRLLNTRSALPSERPGQALERPQRATVASRGSGRLEMVEISWDFQAEMVTYPLVI